MSNLKQNLENKKVISIKKIQANNPQDKDIRSQRRSKDVIESEINMLEQTLATLEQQKETSIQELEAYIAAEKERIANEKINVFEQAKQQGYKEGYIDGENEAKNEYQTYLDEANDIVRKSEQDYIATIEKCSTTIIQLAMHVAEKIIDNEIQTGEHVMKGIVEKAVQHVKDTSTISIYVHPTHYASLHAQKDELEQLLNEDEMLYLYVDSNLQENDCMIRHPFGQIDAGVDTQLKQIKRALQEKVMEN
ncbi:flagellar assembly protein FliH [Pseudogracilibacillus sp. ICA-222130]|uniref:flagellar assembly protein FliH n=1 Tax=Pseudogracilibacillus sp. ICA-222130 TaxID=3134655 RepID=UPI0030BDA0B8